MALSRYLLGRRDIVSALLVSFAGTVGCVPRAHGGRAPDFDLPALDGGRVGSSELSGRVALIAFVASWSKPSRALLSALARLDERYRARGLVVVAIALDGPETVAGVRALTQSSRHVVLLDADGSVMNRYDPQRTVPFVVIVGRDGAIVSSLRGFLSGEGAELEQAVTAAL